MTIRYGFQTYTWQMSYDRHRDKLPAILDVIQAAGGAGVEPEVCMLGPYLHDPNRLRQDLNGKGLGLGALCLALPWLHERETEEERQEADRIIAYLRLFPGTVLTLVQLPGQDRQHLSERQEHAISCVNAVAERAAEQGIVCAYHPNSPVGSVFRTEEDYKVLMQGLDPRYCGYAPDTGHIARGGMDVRTIFKTYRPLIRHVHFKDMSDEGQWTALGQGGIDHPQIVRDLRDSGYSGWIMVEEESKAAEADPDRVTLQNGTYIRDVLRP